MSVQDVAKMYQEGTIKVIKNPKDTFKFGCNQCGNCCTGKMDIMLTPYDIFRIAKGLNITGEEVADKYLSFHIGAESKFPIAMIKFKKPHPFFPLQVCPFINIMNGKPEAKCSVHAFKPFNCAIYPLGRVSKIDVKTGVAEFEYIVQGPDCQCDKTQEHTLEDWLKMFSLEESEKVSLEWTNFLAEATRVTRKVSDLRLEMAEMIYNVLVQLIYVKYDPKTSKEPYEEMIDKLAKAKELLSKFNELSEAFGNPKFNESSGDYDMKTPGPEKLKALMESIKSKSF